MKKIFVTGITGLVGSAFVTALSRDQKGTKFVCLTRKSPVKSAYDRVYDIVKEQCEFDGTPELFDEIIGNIEVVQCLHEIFVLKSEWTHSIAVYTVEKESSNFAKQIIL